MLKIDMLDINEFDEKKIYDKNKKHYKMTQQARRWGSVGYLYPLPCRVGSTGLTAMPPTRGRAELRRTTGRGRAREREMKDDGPRPDRRRRAAAGFILKVARIVRQLTATPSGVADKFNAVLFCI